MSTTHPVRDGWREGASTAESCAVCSRAIPSRKARYCSRACQQRAYRLRQDPRTTLTERGLRQDLQRRRSLAAHTLYECPTCQERFLGERRCPDCNRFCRALGLGGRCPDCDALIVLSALLEWEVLT
jgi:ssDNA-binding Zn-finger/Zn-ribbon topoisomerase 1